jgi:uncharacterized surface protein with fasciclin (FAS1) repeats
LISNSEKLTSVEMNKLILVLKRRRFCFLFLVGLIVTGACSSGKELTDEALSEINQTTTRTKAYANYLGKKPDYTGTSMYEALKAEGNFTHFLKLVDDLDYKTCLSSSILVNPADKTSELIDLTLYVSNDEAFNRFFADNKWGVNQYGALTEQQKKRLLYGSIQYGAFQKHMLSKMVASKVFDMNLNVSYPSYSFIGKGKIVKQKTELSELEGILDLNNQSAIDAFLPNNAYWDALRNQSQLLVSPDGNQPYLVEFLQESLDQRNISNDDLAFILNRNDVASNDFHVFNNKVIDYDIPCKNGFIQELDKVLVSPSNIAEEIRTNSNNGVDVQYGTSVFNNLLDRFSYPLISKRLTEKYDSINHSTRVVYQKKYLCTQDNIDCNGLKQSYVLKYDPSSNGAQTDDNKREIESTLYTLFAPSDEAFSYYETHEGKALMETYGTWNNVPLSIVTPLVNNHLIKSFSETAPSKFNQLRNESNENLGIDKGNVEKQLMSNNGVVYIINKVLLPETFNSVRFPSLVKNNLKIINWAISQLGYEAVLNSKGAIFSFIMPTDEALLNYIDPVSMGKASTQRMKFYYNSSATTETNKVLASIWNCNASGILIDSIGVANYNVIMNRLQDILDNHIIIGDVSECQNGISYFKTKAGGTMKVTYDGHGGYNFYNNSSLVANTVTHVVSAKVYNFSNGKSFESSQVVSKPMLSVYKTMETLAGTETAKGPFYEFFKLMCNSGLFFSVKNNHSTVDYYFSILKSSNYTIYIPTNTAMNEAYTNGLPTVEAINQETNDTKKDAMLSLINRFIKYHVQNDALYSGQEPVYKSYSTMAINNSKSNFLKVSVDNSNSGITITDLKNKRHQVLMTNYGTNPLFNIMTRDYLFDYSNSLIATSIYTSAYSVLHQIDGYLDGGFTNSSGKFILEY